MKTLRDESGFTLMEFSIAAAVLVMIMVSVAGVVYAAQKSTQTLANWGDRSEQLRLAMNLIGEDATYGQWYSASPLYTGNIGSEATIRGYQLKLNTTTNWDATWTNLGWPGWISQSQTLAIDYTIEALDTNRANLVRHVYDPTVYLNNQYKQYSTQVLVYDILPYDVTASNYSYASQVQSQWGNLNRGNVAFNLYVEREGTGGGKQYAPALVQFNVRDPAR